MTLKELIELNEEFDIIIIKQDDDGDPYIYPMNYSGNVDVSPNQGIRMMQTHTAHTLETAIETLQEILKFKVKFPHS